MFKPFVIWVMQTFEAFGLCDHLFLSPSYWYLHVITYFIYGLWLMDRIFEVKVVAPCQMQQLLGSKWYLKSNSAAGRPFFIWGLSKRLYPPTIHKWSPSIGKPTSHGGYLWTKPTSGWSGSRKFPKSKLAWSFWTVTCGIPCEKLKPTPRTELNMFLSGDHCELIHYW